MECVSRAFLVVLAFLVISAGRAVAADESQPQTSEQQPAATANVPPDSDAAQNNRMRALEGSKSPLSAQIQLSYSGSTVEHPFSDQAPNPGAQNPPPVVSMSGLIQGRYRFNEARSLGLGGGVTTETPFQGQKNTTLSDPIVDYAISSQHGAYHNRVDLAANVYTANYETKYGYNLGFSFVNDSLYPIGKSGLTIGMTFAIDANTFSTDRVEGQDIRSVQRDYDFNFYPLVEYSLTKRLNLRSVVGFQYEHTRDLRDMTFVSKRIYETLGLGVSWSDDFFTYFFVQFYPSPLTGIRADNTSVGFSLILNLF